VGRAEEPSRRGCVIPPMVQTLDLSGLLNPPLGERRTKPRGHELSSRERHNPLGAAPSAGDMIAIRFKFSRFSDPQRQASFHSRSPLNTTERFGSMSGTGFPPCERKALTTDNASFSAWPAPAMQLSRGSELPLGPSARSQTLATENA
jgi:hypothetical protein